MSTNSTLRTTGNGQAADFRAMASRVSNKSPVLSHNETEACVKIDTLSDIRVKRTDDSVTAGHSQAIESTRFRSGVAESFHNPKAPITRSAPEPESVQDLPYPALESVANLTQLGRERAFLGRDFEGGGAPPGFPGQLRPRPIFLGAFACPSSQEMVSSD